MRSRGIVVSIIAVTLTVTVLAVSLAVCLTSCTSPAKRPKNYTVPEWVGTKAKDYKTVKQKTVKQQKSSSVNFYYDNTISMEGFAFYKENEKDKGRPANKDGAAEGCMLAIRDVLRHTNASKYTLEEDEDSKALHWSENEDKVDDFYALFKTEAFYTHREKFAKGKDGVSKKGPLTLLPDQTGVFDPAATNIILTDLLEQDENSTELAWYIKQNILSLDGYAAALIAVPCTFHGIVPYNKNRVSVQTKRPLYFIITGPEEIFDEENPGSVYSYLIEALNAHGLKKGLDNYTKTEYDASLGNEKEEYVFFPQIVYAEESVTRVDVNEIVIPSVPTWSNAARFQKVDIEQSTFNCNLALEQQDEYTVYNLFSKDSILTGYFDLNNGKDFNVFRYTPVKTNRKKSSNSMVLNYYIPLPEEKPDQNYYLWLPGKIADSKEYSIEDGDKKKPQIKKNEDDVTYDYVFIGPRKKSASENEDRSESVSEDYPVAYWNSEDGTEPATTKDFRKSFDVTAELIETAALEDGKLPAAELRDTDGSEYSRSRDKTGSENDIDLSKYDYWIHLTVKINQDSFDGPMVAFDLPIYAYRATNRTTPGWVTALNASEENAKYQYTPGLKWFYSNLFPVDTPADDEGKKEQSVIITDIFTFIMNSSESKQD